MDAIRKKMQSLKGETDGLLATIARFESDTKEANAKCDQHDCDIRDLSKKIQGYECDFDETMDKLTKALTALEEKEKLFKTAEEEVSASSRRIMLMEEEAKKADTLLAETVTKLAMASKEADGILKKVKYFENKSMNSEVEIEEADKNLRETTKMASDNEQKLDEMTRKCGVQEDELKRAVERAELAGSKLKAVEEELEAVGENMKQLEISAEKAQEREDKLQDKILQLIDRFKVAEARYEYGEMNITKLNHRIDDIEDEIYREKLKIKKVSDELSDTFDDMLENY
jgi:chromosome segregation ATPase